MRLSLSPLFGRVLKNTGHNYDGNFVPNDSCWLLFKAPQQPHVGLVRVCVCVCTGGKNNCNQYGKAYTASSSTEPVVLCWLADGGEHFSVFIKARSEVTARPRVKWRTQLERLR